MDALRLGLDTLGDDLQPSRAGKRNRRADHRLVVVVVRRAAHHGAVDLDRVEGIPVEVREPALARAEVVECDAQAEPPKLRETLDRQVGIAHELALAHLQLQAGGREPRLVQHAPHQLHERRVGELALRDVHRHREPDVARVVPLAALHARGAQRPLAERHREPGDVGERHEVGGLLQALVAPPAQQRLDAHDRAGLALDHRLPVELELALDERTPQLRLGRLALGGECPRARGVHVPRIAALLLRPRHRDRGAVQQRLRVRAVVREDGHAQARGQQQVVAADAEGAPEREAQLVGDHGHVLVALDARKQDGEDVARRACESIALAQRALERERHRAQQVVAVAAPQPLVDARELVEPQLDHRQLVLVTPGVNDRHRQPVGETPRAREARERVLVRERADLLLEARTRGPFAGEGRLEAPDLLAQGTHLALELELTRFFRAGGGSGRDGQGTVAGGVAGRGGSRRCGGARGIGWRSEFRRRGRALAHVARERRPQ